MRRRRLAADLRRLREERELTIDQVAQATSWHPTKVSRIETGRRSVSPGDVRTLADLYKIPEDDARSLVRLARAARERGWWEAYRDVLPPRYSTYIGLETDASSLQVYEGILIHGLLQTEQYARSVISAELHQASDDEVDARVAVRLERTSVLRSGLNLDVILDEAAIRRQVGNASMRQKQAQHIAELAELPNVSVRVIPYTAGAHAGMSGAFSILDFPGDPKVVYVESPAGDIFVEREPEVNRFVGLFERLAGVTLSPDRSVRLILEAARE
ncbi:helix-turn-helix domain-containing protein [Spongiactinospora sp. 9N601]